MAEATSGEERMWCGHCCVETPIRREGNAGSVKSCNWCGKVLADETGTADEYNQLFLRLQALQDSLTLTNKRARRIKKQ
ncbi:hypothetical protein ISN44_As10g011010 [Arabidopsis suecica]|uniref:Uncharacterized protein n=1 Tax=Arabidopsis suecica TaxID=45249 RepID=A0A8T1ZU22_ARASU|nr:hypothetical protein ISN44_As10g011010 [Arabidopsis suecica]